MNVSIVPIVEGYSEVQSVPILLRRIRDELNAYNVDISRPFRIKRNKVVLEGELEKAIRQATRDRTNVGGFIILLDADDDCPAELGPELLERSRRTTHLSVSVVIAKKELEAWFLGAKESLRGKRGIKDDALPPDNPESIRGAKGCLDANMLNKRYLEIDDQPAFTAQMDLELAEQRCPSFKKFKKDAETLINQLKQS